MADVQSALKELLDKYVTLWNSGNAAGISELYTEDSKVLPPNAKAVKGSADIKTFLEGLFADGLTTAKRADFELEQLGPDFAFGTGRWTFTNQEGELAATFKSIALYKKVDGTWKVYRLLYNSN